MPFCYKHPDYWHVIEKETKRTGDMINSRKLFDDSAWNPFRFSGEYVKDDAANWFWNLYETGISGSKKVSERMPESTAGY